MAKILPVSRILQLFSQAFGKVKEQQNMRNE